MQSTSCQDGVDLSQLKYSLKTLRFEIMSHYVRYAKTHAYLSVNK